MYLISSREICRKLTHIRHENILIKNYLGHNHYSKLILPTNTFSVVFPLYSCFNFFLFSYYLVSICEIFNFLRHVQLQIALAILACVTFYKCVCIVWTTSQNLPQSLTTIPAAIVALYTLMSLTLLLSDYEHKSASLAPPSSPCYCVVFWAWSLKSCRSPDLPTQLPSISKYPSFTVLCKQLWTDVVQLYEGLLRFRVKNCQEYLGTDWVRDTNKLAFLSRIGLGMRNIPCR